MSPVEFTLMFDNNGNGFCMVMMTLVSGTEVELHLCSRAKCPNSLQATSTARSVAPTITYSHPASAQITQPAFLKPLYFEVPRSSPSNLVGRSWLFREVKPKHSPSKLFDVDFFAFTYGMIIGKQLFSCSLFAQKISIQICMKLTLLY